MDFSDDIQYWSVDFIEEVKEDVASISAFIADKTKSEYYGDRFAATVDKVLQSLSTWPYSHRQYSDDLDSSVRRIEIPGYHAALLYKTYDETLEVIAVMAFHTMQDPDIYNKIIKERVAIADAKIDGA